MDKDKLAIFAQTDPRWARRTIGTSGLTLRGWGCTITSTCRALFLLSGQVITPPEMEDQLGFTGDGLIKWETFDRIGLKAQRFREQKPESFKKGMLIELNYNPRHWVCYESLNTDGTIQVMDPLKADIVTKKFSEISGYTYLELIPVPKKELTAFEKEILDATEFIKMKGWSNGDRPKDFLTRGEFWVTLKRLSEKL